MILLFKQVSFSKKKKKEKKKSKTDHQNQQCLRRRFPCLEV